MDMVPPMRTGLDMPDRNPVPLERRAMLMCIHHCLTREAVAVCQLYTLQRYTLQGKHVDKDTESDVMKQCMKYIILCGVGAELEQILHAVMHGTDVDDPSLIEKYKQIVEFYPQVVERMTRGDTNASISTWLTEAGSNAVQDSDSDEDSVSDSDEDTFTTDDILEGVDKVPEQWAQFVPQTDIQRIVKQVVDRLE